MPHRRAKPTRSAILRQIADHLDETAVLVRALADAEIDDDAGPGAMPLLALVEAEGDADTEDEEPPTEIDRARLKHLMETKGGWRFHR